jgi:hypothetical protein
VYGGDMPIEESGNMLTLTAAIMMHEGWTTWARKYWNIAKRWADYLVANGQDPAEQLCTDDFAGHWAHNCNLSVKAIMGVAAFAKMCYIRGEATESDTYMKMGDEYMQTARKMAVKWESDARDGNHYRLAFDRPNTWSQKYNMVWDKLWQTNLFPNRAAEREIRYYLTKQNTYGLPLDIRESYTKSDWIMWTAAMSPDTDTFLRFLEPLYKYVNETRSRVPLCDWYWTKNADMRGFRARSVIAGHWMKVLMDKTIGTSEAAGWKPADESVLTTWGAALDTTNVLPEYPRPSLQRSEWMNLNGLWDYAITNTLSEPSAMQGRILVPFPLESSLSGVGTYLDDGSYLWYKREFTLPGEWEGRRIQLNFGAVDYSCYVWVNGKVVKRNNVGGYASFTADITDCATFDQPNTLLLRVADATNGARQPIGNQRLNPSVEGHHPSVSGIWQTVWVEPVGDVSITSLRTEADPFDKKLTLHASTTGTSEKCILHAILREGNHVVAEATEAVGTPLVLRMNDYPRLWTPDDPFLYDIELTITRGDSVIDHVHSYTAFRTIGTGIGYDSPQRLLLNGEPQFMLGVIDEGLWPDGLYTAPSDEAIIYDIEKAKTLGYNTIRKHQKVESDRWYWHADRLGMLVWQDMPALNNVTEEWTPDGWYTGKEGTQSASVNSNFRSEWSNIINQLSVHPSVIVWTPFEEARGQYRTAEITAMTRETDGTRLVDAASGGNHYEGVGDLLDLHVDAVPSALSFYDPTRPLVFGRCGIATAQSDVLTTDDYLTTIDGLFKLAVCENQADRYLSAAMPIFLASPENDAEGAFSLLSFDRRKETLDASLITTANEELCRVLIPQGIGTLRPEKQGSIVYYNVMGIEVPASTTGILLIRHPDGSVTKRLKNNQ